MFSIQYCNAKQDFDIVGVFVFEGLQVRDRLAQFQFDIRYSETSLDLGIFGAVVLEKLEGGSRPA
jgi:hypothetical protein